MADNQQSTKISLGKAPKGLSSLGAGIKFPSAEHAARLEEVAEQIATIKQLITTVNQLETKLLNLAAKQTPELAESEAQIWQAAAQKIGNYLHQPIQVASDKKPLPLESTLDLLSSWVNAFEQNLAVDGVGLREDEERLANFAAKVGSVGALANQLNQAGQKLLQAEELNQTRLEANLADQQKAVAQDQNRLTAIDTVLNNFYTQWEDQVTNLETDLAKLAEELKNLPADTNPLIKKQAEAGLKQLESLKTDKLVRVRTQLGQWVNKYRADKSFTADQLNEQIQAELLPLMNKYQVAAGKVKNQYSLKALKERQLAHENQLKNGLVERLNKLLTKTQERQNSLINLRRLKLGREPDERYFGAMAKQVNNAIKGLTELAEENKTLVGQISTSNEFATLVDQLEAKVTEQLKTSQQYSDTTQLEKLLETSWQAEAIAELTEVITQADQDLAKVKNKLDELAPADENLAKFRELEGKLEQALTQGHDLIETPTNPDEFSAVGEEIEEDTAELRAELIALSKQPELPAETKAQKIVVKTATTEIAKANQEEQSLVETSGQDDQNKIVAVNKAQPKFGFHPPIKTSQPEVNKPTTKADEQTETPAKNPDEFNEQLQQTQPHESEINQQLRNDLELGLKHFKTRLKASLAYFKKLEVYNKDWAANWYERIKTATDQPIIAGEKITLKQLLTDSPDLNTNQLQFAQLAVSNQGQLALLLKEMESYLENHPLKVYDERRQELQSLFGKVGQRERLTKSRQVQLNTLKQKDVTGKPAEIATYGQKLIELDNQLSKASELLSKLKKEVNDLKDFEVTNPRFATLFNNLNERLDQVAVPELTLPAVTTDKITNSESLGKPNLAQQRSSVEKLIE